MIRELPVRRPCRQEGHVYPSVPRGSEMHCRKGRSRVTIWKSMKWYWPEAQVGGRLDTSSAKSERIRSNLEPVAIICVNIGLCGS